MKKTKQISLQIDVNRLDEEWVDQPVKYAKFASAMADARFAWEEAKRSLELVKAELDRDIRNDPENYGLDKPTEAKITAAIIRQNEYQDAQKSVNEKRHEMDLLDAYVTALDHRKSAMSKLVELFLANYFSRPKASDRAKASADEWEKKATRVGRSKRKLTDD